MVRVLHVTPSIDARSGGPAMGTVGLSTALAEAGLQVKVLAAWSEDRPDTLAQQLREKGVEVELVGPVRGQLGRHPALRSALAAAIAQCDVVHIHAIWAEIQHLASVESRRARRPYVITPHGMLDPWSLRQGWLKKKLYMMWRQRRDLDRAAALHFTTAMERDQSARVGLAPQGIVEPNGIDWSEFENLPPAGALRTRYPQTGDRPIIAFLGRVHPGKGVEYLIPALAQMKKDAALAVIGPDSEGFLPRMQALAHSLGVGSRVVFTGMLRGPERIAALVDAQVFCLPSEHENFGVAVVEALACGLPVVLSQHVAIWREIVAAGVGSAVGLNADELGVALERWISDPDPADAAAAARGFARDTFQWNRIAGRWLEHYRRLHRARAQPAFGA